MLFVNPGTLLWKVDRSSSFCKYPRTSKIWKSKDSFYYSPILDGNENSWIVMSTTPRIVWQWTLLSKKNWGEVDITIQEFTLPPQKMERSRHYHPRIFTSTQNHILMIQKFWKWAGVWTFSSNVPLFSKKNEKKKFQLTFYNCPHSIVTIFHAVICQTCK